MTKREANEAQGGKVQRPATIAQIKAYARAKGLSLSQVKADKDWSARVTAWRDNSGPQ